MNKLISSILLVLLILSPTAYAHEGHCEDTELGFIMSKMKQANKKLKKAISKENYAKAVAYSDELVLLSKDSMTHKPLKLKHDPTLDVEAYKQGMRETADILAQLSAALKNGEKNEIEALFSKLNKAKKQGHKKYRIECD